MGSDRGQASPGPGPAVGAPASEARPRSARAYPEPVWAVFACPQCGFAPLEREATGARCPRCPESFPYAPTGALDLSLRRPKTARLEVTLADPLPDEDGVYIGVLPRHPSPEVDFSRVGRPEHLTPAMVSYFPRARRKGALMLDLGCGDKVHEEVYTHAGYTYVGLDREAASAPLIGDAQALPFRDGSFEFILSTAMLEHIRYPGVMLRETYRVLEPGGVFIGTVAFLEAFHGDSFYHHTHLGTLSALQAAGFRVTHLAPNETWPALIAMARMALFPRMPAPLARALVRPLQWLHELWWKAGRLADRDVTTGRRLRNTAGSFYFRAVKEA